MDNDLIMMGIGFVVGLAMCMILWAAPVTAAYNELLSEAIERNFAIHDPVTGDWRWKTDSEVAK